MFSDLCFFITSIPRHLAIGRKQCSCTLSHKNIKAKKGQISTEESVVLLICKSMNKIYSDKIKF